MPWDNSVSGLSAEASVIEVILHEKKSVSNVKGTRTLFFPKWGEKTLEIFSRYMSCSDIRLYNNHADCFAENKLKDVREDSERGDYMLLL